MNKSEKIIVAILGLLQVGYFWHSTSQAKKEAEEQAKILHEQAAAAGQKPAAPAQKKGAAAQKPGATVWPAVRETMFTSEHQSKTITFA